MKTDGDAPVRLEPRVGRDGDFEDDGQRHPDRSQDTGQRDAFDTRVSTTMVAAIG